MPEDPLVVHYDKRRDRLAIFAQPVHQPRLDFAA
jgi:hypothetical protein